MNSVFQSPCGEVVVKVLRHQQRERDGRKKFVSVPLRGSGGESQEIRQYLEGRLGDELFQSPCGEVVVKVSSATISANAFSLSFQSPCGEVVVKES